MAKQVQKDVVEYLIIERDEIDGSIEIHPIPKGEAGQKYLDKLLNDPNWPITILESFSHRRHARKWRHARMVSDAENGIYHH